jgi:hypothetical protein
MGKTQNRLLTDVENFLARNGMSARQFGLKVKGDTRLVTDLRSGRRKFSSEYVDKVNAFIEEYRG